MNLSALYDRFIADRRTREASLAVYETHHVVPRCLDGTDDAENLIRLSLQDHLFAHVLLARIHGGLLLYPLVWMLNQERYAGRRSRLAYEALRTAHRLTHSDAVRAMWADPDSGLNSPEARQRKSDTLTRLWQDPEFREGRLRAIRDPDVGARKGNSLRGRTASPEVRERVRQGKLRTWADPDFRAKMAQITGTDEHRARLSAANSGRQNRIGHRASDETRARMSQSQRDRRAAERLMVPSTNAPVTGASCPEPAHVKRAASLKETT